MSWNARSLGAWAGSVAESVLRDPGLSGPHVDGSARGVLDPHGSLCRVDHPGHLPQRVAVARATRHRQEGAAELVRGTAQSLVEAGSLSWSGDAVEGSDPTRLVARVTLERRDGTAFTVLTHDQRAVAAIEACDGEGLWWAERWSIVSIPSWDDLVLISDSERAPRSWPALSVVLEGQPWLPCPVAVSHGRTRTW